MSGLSTRDKTLHLNHLQKCFAFCPIHLTPIGIFWREGRWWMTIWTLTHLPHTWLTNIEAYILKISVRELPTCPPCPIKIQETASDGCPLEHSPIDPWLTNYILSISVWELPTCPPGLKNVFFKRRLLMDDHSNTHPLAPYLTYICLRAAHLPTRS